MGCNNSHLRPLFRRCRRRSKKEETNCTTPSKRGGSGVGGAGQGNDLLVDSNHIDSAPDLLHGFQFLGSSMRGNSKVLGGPGDLGASSTSSDQPLCVPLLAQSLSAHRELSHSQIDFFKMLDDKIQQGPDYDSDEDKKETELLIKRNLDTWHRTIQNSSASWKASRVTGTSGCGSGSGGGSSRLGNHNSKLNRCQWDDEGD